MRSSFSDKYLVKDVEHLVPTISWDFLWFMIKGLVMGRWERERLGEGKKGDGIDCKGRLGEVKRWSVQSGANER